MSDISFDIPVPKESGSGGDFEKVVVEAGVYEAVLAGVTIKEKDSKWIDHAKLEKNPSEAYQLVWRFSLLYPVGNTKAPCQPHAVAFVKTRPDATDHEKNKLVRVCSVLDETYTWDQHLGSIEKINERFVNKPCMINLDKVVRDGGSSKNVDDCYNKVDGNIMATNRDTSTDAMFIAIANAAPEGDSKNEDNIPF